MIMTTPTITKTAATKKITITASATTAIRHFGHKTDSMNSFRGRPIPLHLRRHRQKFVNNRKHSHIQFPSLSPGNPLDDFPVSTADDEATEVTQSIASDDLSA